MNGLEEHTETAGFEKSYLALRSKENRLYSDGELLLLPRTGPTHPHADEWKLREESAGRLIGYFSGKPSLQRILEIGCGNGWLIHKISLIPDRYCTGLDCCLPEIEQARRVFGTGDRLRFLHGQPDSEALHGGKFDSIVFAASFQYFASPRDIISWSLRRLEEGGEIHILDTPFYSETEWLPARRRTIGYYNSLGFPGLSDFYFHHRVAELEPFNPEWLYRPGTINRLLKGNRNPFPWIRIRKKEKA